MARKRERGNGDGDVWSRKNKQGKIIGYRASYWVDTPSGPKSRYVSGKNKGETRAALSKARAGKEDGFVPDAGATTLGDYWTGGSRTRAAPCGSARGSATSRSSAST
jgi:hypothetical protein